MSSNNFLQQIVHRFDGSNPYLLYTYTFLAIVFVRYALLPTMWPFASRTNPFPISGRTAIVTGGSQGFGLALARELSRRGAHVVIVAQNESKIQSAVSQITSTASSPSSQRFLGLSYDLRSPASGPEILRRVTEWNPSAPPDLLFLCAGSCHPSFFADADIEILRSQMDTIYWSAAYMAHAALNLWKGAATSAMTKAQTSSPARHIIFTSSTLAYVPVAGYAPYTPAKAAMRALADTLHQEVEVYNGARLSKSPVPGAASPDADIKIHIVLPMGITSPGFDNETQLKPLLTKELEKGDKPQTPDEVAQITIRGLEKGEFMITTAFLGHLMRGAGMSGTLRMSIQDVFWNFMGSVVILFALPDILAKCRTWGKRHGSASTGTKIADSANSA